MKRIKHLDVERKGTKMAGGLSRCSRCRRGHRGSRELRSDPAGGDSEVTGPSEAPARLTPEEPRVINTHKRKKE